MPPAEQVFDINISEEVFSFLIVILGKDTSRRVAETAAFLYDLIAEEGF